METEKIYSVQCLTQDNFKVLLHCTFFTDIVLAFLHKNYSLDVTWFVHNNLGLSTSPMPGNKLAESKQYLPLTPDNYLYLDSLFFRILRLWITQNYLQIPKMCIFIVYNVYIICFCWFKLCPELEVNFTKSWFANRRFVSSMTTLCTIISELKRWRFLCLQNTVISIFRKTRQNRARLHVLCFNLGTSN